MKLCKYSYMVITIIIYYTFYRPACFSFRNWVRATHDVGVGIGGSPGEFSDGDAGFATNGTCLGLFLCSQLIEDGIDMDRYFIGFSEDKQSESRLTTTLFVV